MPSSAARARSRCVRRRSAGQRRAVRGVPATTISRDVSDFLYMGDVTVYIVEHRGGARDRGAARQLRHRARRVLRSRRCGRRCAGASMPAILSSILLMADDIAQTGSDSQREAQPVSPRRRFSCSQVLSRWLVSGPPLLYLIALLRHPDADHGAGVVPLRRASSAASRRCSTTAGKLDLNARKLHAVLHASPSTPAVFLKSFCVRARHDADLPRARVSAGALIARSPKKHRNLLLLLVILPFWSNFLIRIYAWMIILGPQAALARGVERACSACSASSRCRCCSARSRCSSCLVYVHLPFMVLPLYANLEKHDQTLLDAAQDLGAERLAALLARSRFRCRCRASTRARRWCSFRRSASSRSPTSWAAPTTA